MQLQLKALFRSGKFEKLPERFECGSGFFGMRNFMTSTTDKKVKCDNLPSCIMQITKPVIIMVVL